MALKQALQKLKIPPAVVAHQLLQIRNKNVQRFKAPPTGKSGDKWIPREKKGIIRKSKEVPKNYETKFLTRVPVDDVWIRAYFPRPVYTLAEAISMHRELLHPEMLDAMDSMVYFTAKLDMSTKKKTKFMGNVKSLVVVPHWFDDGQENNILAFTKGADEKEKAIAAGASYAGGLELVKTIESGQLVGGVDFNIVVCGPEMLTEIALIKKYLRDRFPNSKNGTLGADVPNLVERFKLGKAYESTKEDEATGMIEVAIGNLDMSQDQLTENIGAYLDALSSHKQGNLGPFVKEAYITCQPSWEKFKLVQEELLPTSQRKPSPASVTEPKEDDNEPLVATAQG